MIYQNCIKRPFDFLLALALVILLAPLMFLLAFLIAFKMGRPIIFSQIRTGYKQQPFLIFKFRTMITAPDLTDEARVTRFGLLLRRFSLDEMPQLINVLRGDMSFVGPRPLLPEYDEHYSPKQQKRFLVRPGLTGLAQIEGRNGLSWEQKFSYDVEYASKSGFFLDLYILLKTVPLVLTAAGFSAAGEKKKFSS